jgi:hypothetical protein
MLTLWVVGPPHRGFREPPGPGLVTAYTVPRSLSSGALVEVAWAGGGWGNPRPEDLWAGVSGHILSACGHMACVTESLMGRDACMYTLTASDRHRP